MKKEMWSDIEKLSELRSNYSCFDEREQPYYHALSLGIEGIKALKQTRWIPVSERLPEKEGLYLVSVKNKHDRRYSKTCWFHGGDNWFARQDIIAWMPLPEPYKAESEDKE